MVSRYAIPHDATHFKGYIMPKYLVQYATAHGVEWLSVHDTLEQATESAEDYASTHEIDAYWVIPVASFVQIN